MAWLVYDFTSEDSVSIIGEWIRSEDLSRADIGAFKRKVLLLKQYGPEVPPGLLAGPIHEHIYKFRVNTAEHALRPMLCKGPIDNDNEFTFLAGCIEYDGELDPPDAPEVATTNRGIVIQFPSRRQKR